jgi:hypothetical protein
MDLNEWRREENAVALAPLPTVRQTGTHTQGYPEDSSDVIASLTTLTRLHALDSSVTPDS